MVGKSSSGVGYIARGHVSGSMLVKRPHGEIG
jgi:hypothetical protein